MSRRFQHHLSSNTRVRQHKVFEVGDGEGTVPGEGVAVGGDDAKGGSGAGVGAEEDGVRGGLALRHGPAEDGGAESVLQAYGRRHLAATLDGDEKIRNTNLKA